MSNPTEGVIDQESGQSPQIAALTRLASEGNLMADALLRYCEGVMDSQQGERVEQGMSDLYAALWAVKGLNTDVSKVSVGVRQYPEHPDLVQISMFFDASGAIIWSAGFSPEKARTVATSITTAADYVACYRDHQPNGSRFLVGQEVEMLFPTPKVLEVQMKQKAPSRDMATTYQKRGVIVADLGELDGIHAYQVAFGAMTIPVPGDALSPASPGTAPGPGRDEVWKRS